MIGAAFEHIFLPVVDNQLRHTLASADAQRVPAALQLGDRVRRQTVPLVVETIGHTAVTEGTDETATKKFFSAALRLRLNPCPPWPPW